MYSALLAKSEYAYRAAGWSAAAGVVNRIIASELEGAADDGSILACQASWLAVYITLRLVPDQCRAAILQGEDAVSSSAAREAIQQMGYVCDALRTDGLRQIQRNARQITITDEQWITLLTHIRSAPDPLSSSEQAALEQPLKSPAATVCEANIKLNQNVLTLSPTLGAAYMRDAYQFEGRDDVVSNVRLADRPAVVVPNDFVCPAAGTVFTLSISNLLGIPVQWTSLGNSGFDCKIKSSVSGVHGLWANLRPDSPARPINNPIKALWPVSVGKHAHFSYHPAVGDDQEIENVVTSFGRHEFSGKQIATYEVAEEWSLNGGENEYTIFRYWSPDLNWIVGQRTITIQGARPPNVGPDWHVVSMSRPSRPLAVFPNAK